MMSDHFKEVCKFCETTVSQYRCPDPNKTVTKVICEKCAKMIIGSVKDDSQNRSLRRLLLGSGGHGVEERKSALIKAIKDFLGEEIKTVLFIPYALKDYDWYVNMMVQEGLNAEYHLDSIHYYRSPKTAIIKAHAIYMGGGNTFVLLDELYKRGLVDIIRDRVLSGTPYIGTSAGANLACPTIMTTNDMPIVYPPSFNALDLVPFQINPHYTDGIPEVGYRGENRELRIKEYHERHDNMVIGLREGSILKIENEKVSLLGTASAKLFRKEKEPVEYSPGSDLSFLLA